MINANTLFHNYSGESWKYRKIRNRLYTYQKKCRNQIRQYQTYPTCDTDSEHMVIEIITELKLKEMWEMERTLRWNKNELRK